ncbi:MAG: gluconate 2-dehydrogenase subunit 3 family protein [Balneolaceae bacterium]|nr:gluconate 2-dehydrogenase subunit 3 family protein [Balneolaceae bacterium]MCH8548602.1 gluconate 2-dehydrogenase subunit 3 family protein [Balneolaceae bacterium]
MDKIDRREAIKRTAMLMGGVVFAPTMLGVLKGCSPSRDEWTPTLFNSEQAALTIALASTIIPADDTPGAADVGVPGFIESMVQDIYEEDQREMFLEGLDQFDAECREETGSSFAELNEEDRYEFALAKNNDAIEFEAVDYPQFFLVFKELTMVGFFRSEPGATQVLRYEDVPGVYQSCIPFEDVGRTWAT